MPPEKMTPFDLWRARVEAAKKVWVGRGLIGSSEPSTMRMMMEFYRSNQWVGLEGWGSLDDEELLVVNKIFPAANSMQAKLAVRNPKVNYFARNEEWEEFESAVKALHDYDIKEQKHIRQFNAAFRDKQFSPLGLVRHGFTPAKEFDTPETERKRKRRMQMYRPARPDRPWLRRIAPWNALMDPFCETFHPDGGMRWCAFRDVMRKDDIRDNPNMTIERDELERHAGNIAPEWAEMQDPALKDSGSPDLDDFFEVWTVYEAAERTWFQLTLSGPEDFLRKPDEWPIPWETLPINVFTTNSQMDTPFDISLMEMQAPLQVELNQTRTMMHQGVLRGRKMTFIDTNKIDEDDVTRIKNGDMNEFFMGTNIKDAINTVNTSDLPQGAFVLQQQIVEDMREAGGQSKMDRGQRVNVETAEEARGIREGSSEADSRVQGDFETFIEEAEALYMQGRRFIMDETDQTEIVRIVGNDKSPRLFKWAEVDAEQLHGEYAFELVAGSTLKETPGRRAQQASVDLQLGLKVGNEVANIPLLWRKYLEERGIDPTEGVVPEAQELADLDRKIGVAERAVGLAGQGGAGARPRPQPQPIDANAAELLGRPQ